MSSTYFPWRLYTKIFLSLFFSVVGIFVLSVALATRGFQSDALSAYTPSLVVSFLVLAFLVSAGLSLRLTMPLRRVFLKAMRMASKKKTLGLPEVDVEVFKESGEYFELEQALDKIQKKLKKRRVQLAHEREESQTLMSFLSDAVFSLDREENVVFFNSKFATLFLTAEQVNQQGENFQIKLSDIFQDVEILEKIQACSREGHPENLQQKIATRLEPTGRYFSLSVSPLREEKDREIYGVLGIFHDITDLKRAEKIRVEFVENASHELRTPLTSIKGYVKTAIEDAEMGHFEQVPGFLQTISKSVDRLIELVNDLLIISTLESNPTLNWTEISPEILTSEVLERLSPLASAKQILIRSRVDCDPFMGDIKLVDQVLSNLVGNAIKYIPESKQVTVEWLQPDDSHVALVVRDDGQGIGEEHLGRLFERFYRVDRGRSRDAGGTGLGLSIVKHVMQSHGGTVTVKSRQGQGAEFICRFPTKL